MTAVANRTKERLAAGESEAARVALDLLPVGPAAESAERRAGPLTEGCIKVARAQGPAIDRRLKPGLVVFYSRQVAVVDEILSGKGKPDYLFFTALIHLFRGNFSIDNKAEKLSKIFIREFLIGKRLGIGDRPDKYA